MIKACVLRSGGDFGPEHVRWLARQVPDLVCLTDTPVEGVECIALEHDWPGWWAKMEMFGPSLTGDVLMIDLDTVVLRMPEMPDRTTVLENFADSGWMGSGFMYVTAADRARVWAGWMQNPEKHMRDNRTWPKWGDQGFLQDYIGGAARWGENVRSYKIHIRGRALPPGVDVVCMHGRPRPWEARESWIPSL